jgi:16S rRNA (guanine527-N7)-methyltransferase
MSMDDRSRLCQGAAQLGIELSEAQQDALLHYLALLVKWNRVYALISRRDGDDWLARHLLDSLAVLPYINGSRVIDVGSGAGLPGIPLAIMQPDVAFTLLDSNSKKARFMTQAVIELGLKNVTVVDRRAEEFRPETGFDCVVSRAFATIADMLGVAGHLVTDNGHFLAMKGVFPDQELEQLPSGYRAEAVHILVVPFQPGERHLAVVVHDE